MDWVILLAALPLLLVLVFQKYKNAPRLPPGPKGLPFIGNLHQMESHNPQHFMHRLSKIYGPIMSFKIGSKRVVVVSSAELAKEALKTQDLNFCNRPLLCGQQKMSYKGLDLGFGQYTPYYREMRKLYVINLFSPKTVQSFSPVRVDEVSRMMDKMTKAALEAEIIDLSEMMLSFTNAVVCRTAFGKRYAEYGEEMRRFIELLYETQAMLGVFFFTDYFPYLGWLDHFTGLRSRLNKAAKALDIFLQGIINERLDPNMPKPEKECLIDLLLQFCKDQPFSSVEFTHQNVKALIMDVVIAGTDTAAAAVVWAMTYLMKNPEALKKVQEEVRSLVGDRGYVTEDDVPNLTYMKAVVKEALRLEPVIPLLLHREALEDCKIGGYDIPAKTILQVNAWAIARDREAWGQNPEEFRPERYIDKPVDYKGQDFELIPFGSGRRMCPGMHLGVAMLELPFANLLYKFDWELPPGVKAEEIKMDVMTGLAMHKKDHLLLLPKKHI